MKKGTHLTPEQRKKYSDIALKDGRGKWMIGRKLSPEHIKNRSIAQSGNKNGSWIDGRSENKEYRSWLKNKRNRMPKEGGHSWSEWETLKAQYNWTCPCCKKQEPEIKLTQDHIIPLSKGGSDNIENIQPLCGSCNCHKHVKTIKY